jgi:thymidylate synthase ThyX
MKLIKPYYEILTPINGDEILKTIEKVARTCYKSEEKITEDSAQKMVKSLISKGHEAMIEFFDITVKFICDRGISHEIVRHRLASYAQESTRYVSSIDKSFFIINNEENVIENYNSGMTMKRISELSKGLYNEWDIYKILNKNDIKRRNHNRKGILNENYFSIIDTSLKSYLLGFIQADGSIRTDLKGFSISQKKEFSWFLENLIKKEFYTEVHRCPDKDSHSLNIYSEHLVNDLVIKGIIPDKSHKQTKENINSLWNSVPNEFIPDFIRGILDGDGWVRFFLQNEKTKSCNIGWSGNQFLLNKISEWFKETFNYVAKVSLVSGCDNTYRLSITTPSKAKEITSKLYKNFIFPFGHPNKTSKVYNFNKFNYIVETIGDDKFCIIQPLWIKNLNVENWIWLENMYIAEDSYRELMRLGWQPQQARSVLPNSLKTEINVKMNLREWRHFFKLRTSAAAHPQMREITIPLLNEFKSKISIVFDDIII